MATSDEWNKKECPNCGTALAESDLARVARQARATEVGSVSLQKPDDWWELSCGHRVEIMVDRRTSDSFSFKLTERPTA